MKSESNSMNGLLAQHKSIGEYYTPYVDYLREILGRVDPKAVEQVGTLFLEARAAGRLIFFAGNGGSAATASHFAQDLAEVGRKVGVPGFRSLSLSDAAAHITAVGNDYSYADIFSAQMRDLFTAGDVLVVISCSGNSPNAVKAAQLANAKGGKTIGLLGFDGGELARICQHVVLVKANKGEYGPVEDVHMIFDHIIITHLTNQLRRGNGQ